MRWLCRLVGLVLLLPVVGDAYRWYERRAMARNLERTVALLDDIKAIQRKGLG